MESGGELFMERVKEASAVERGMKEQYLLCFFQEKNERWFELICERGKVIYSFRLFCGLVFCVVAVS